MHARPVRIPIACAALALLAAGAALAQPQEVPPRSVRGLDRASYVSLARQWRAWIDEHGETPSALVNLGMAYEYTDEKEAATKAARRAVALGPDDARALTFLGKMLMVFADSPDSAVTILEHCRAIAPDYGYGLTMLASLYLRRGELDRADGVFRDVFERRVYAAPLQDYAYNMLIGLPEGAVLLTNGDNDTFPVLALQAGKGLRPDVIVLNYSLLELPAYAEAEFARHPGITPDYDVAGHRVRMVDGKPTLLSTALVKRLIAEGKAPVYIAASVPSDRYDFAPQARIEGINLRASGKGLEPEAAARLFLDAYRLDSATDWSQPWDLAPSQAKLMGNYVAAMAWTVQEKGVSKDVRDRLLDRAEAIADFHGFTAMAYTVAELRKR